jgi:hypothetical protein
MLGHAPTPGQASLRTLAKVFILPLNWICIIIWIARKTPYYDVFAKTRVVRALPPKPAPPSVPRPAIVEVPPAKIHLPAVTRGLARDLAWGVVLVVAALALVDTYDTLPFLLLAGAGYVTLGAWSRVPQWLPHAMRSRPAVAVAVLLAAGVAPSLVALRWDPILHAAADERPFAGRYVVGSRDFSIEFPTGWIRKSHDYYAVFGCTGSADGKSRCARNVGVIANRRSALTESLDEYFASYLKRVTAFDGFRELDRGATSVAGVDARFILYTLRDEGVRKEVVLRTREYGYILVEEAITNDWEQAQPVLDAIAASFLLE